MANPGDVEILVHITAPSRAADDARYRALASAYLDFQPTKHVNFFDQPAEPRDAEVAEALPSQANRSKGPGGTQPSASLGEYLPSLTSPQASFRSVLDNADSPLHAGRGRIHAPHSQGIASQSGLSQASWKSPPSVVQDSIPENNAVTSSILTTPTRVLEHYLQNFTSPSSLASQGTSQQRGVSQRRGRRGQRSSLSQSLTSQTGEVGDLPTIPCTPGTAPPQGTSTGLGPNTSSEFQPSQGSRNTRDGRRTNPEDEEEVIDDSLVMNQPDTPLVSRADSEPPSKRPRRGGLKDPQVLLRAMSDVGPRGTTSTSQSPFPILPIPDRDNKSLDIRAPEPPVGCAPLTPEDLVTPELRNLASDLNLVKRFKPEVTTRDLRPFERGYWRVDWADWTPELRTDMWNFLANHIGTGASGWGVSCSRDEEFTWLRVYCWGAIAGHIYLLVYLASERKISYAGVTWVDGEGADVISMGKRRGVWQRTRSTG